MDSDVLKAATDLHGKCVVSAEQFLTFRMRNFTDVALDFTRELQVNNSIAESRLEAKYNRFIDPEQFDHALSETRRLLSESPAAVANEDEFPQLVSCQKFCRCNLVGYLQLPLACLVYSIM